MIKKILLVMFAFAFWVMILITYYQNMIWQHRLYFFSSRSIHLSLFLLYFMFFAVFAGAFSVLAIQALFKRSKDLDEDFEL